MYPPSAFNISVTWLRISKTQTTAPTQILRIQARELSLHIRLPEKAFTLTAKMEELEQAGINYSSDDIKTLDWKEHIRRRPGMLSLRWR